MLFLATSRFYYGCLRGARLKHFENASLNIPPRSSSGRTRFKTSSLVPTFKWPEPFHSENSRQQTAVLRNEIRDFPLWANSLGLSVQPHATLVLPEGVVRTSSSRKSQSGSRSDIHPGGMSFYWLQRIQNGARHFIWTYEECLWYLASLHNFIHSRVCVNVCVWSYCSQWMLAVVMIHFKALIL